MSKELTPLEALRIIKYSASEFELLQHNKLYETIETALKALEIIKEYELDMKVIIYCIENNIDYAEYVDEELWVEAQDKSPMKPMPQEEFDLLKEVLHESKM